MADKPWQWQRQNELFLAGDLRDFKVGQIHQIVFIGPLSCTPVVNCASVITVSSHRSNSSTAANSADQLSCYTSNKLAFFTSYWVYAASTSSSPCCMLCELDLQRNQVYTVIVWLSYGKDHWATIASYNILGHWIPRGLLVSIGWFLLYRKSAPSSVTQRNCSCTETNSTEGSWWLYQCSAQWFHNIRPGVATFT